MSKPKKFDQIKLVRDFVVANIKIIGSNQKEFMKHLDTTENVILALMRHLKIDIKELAVLIKDTAANQAFSQELGKELGLGVFNENKDEPVPAPKRSNRKKSE